MYLGLFVCMCVSISGGREAGQHYDEDAPRHLRIDRMKLEVSPCYTLVMSVEPSICSAEVAVTKGPSIRYEDAR
jgi:hypothetical protein